MVQTKDDGTHAILPVAALADPAGSACELPRESDGDMRRDGSEAAEWLRSVCTEPAVDERGRVHGAPDLRVPEGSVLHRGTEY